YIDAITHGIDPLPTITPEIRTHVLEIYNSQGLDRIIDLLRELDPEILLTSDLKNHRRLVHALEITMQSGKPYSSLRSGQAKNRDFRIIKVAIEHTRERLFERINTRVDQMITDGLIEEARRVYPLRHLNSLNTVGYKELFSYFDGKMELDTAIARIAKNTRVYAKKQLLWLSKDPELHRLNPSLPLLQQVLRLL
ncbi:MAG: tRNA (adenosine(37)-N6)-dimethylallyltransferase MiaA, partial [Duncaniella sp.]|nr:tRNA (adenosine(37)-N6)-dimethylallyltransferase MiaA [Duncaniella sp.]